MTRTILALLLFLSAAPAPAQLKGRPERCLVQDCLIKDGVGVENILVGQSVAADVFARFGDGYEVFEHNKYSYELRYEELGLSFYYRYDDGLKKIFQMDARPPFRGVTAGGLVLGKSTLEEAEKKYWPSNFSSSAPEGETRYLEYPGIQFHVKAGEHSSDESLRKRRIIEIGVAALDPPPPPAGLRPSPVEVSAGPLLFVLDAVEASGRREVAHYVVDPEVSAEPRPFLKGFDDYRPWHRFNRDEFLLGSDLIPSDLFYLNVKTGKVLELLPGGLTSLYKVDGDQVFFVEQEHSGRGFAPNAEGARAEKPQSRHTRRRLYVFDRASASPPRLVTKEALLHILAVDEKYCWVVLDRPRPELWRVARDGGEQKKVAEVKDGWVFSLEDAAASPDGRLLALGVTGGDKLWMRTLVVIDVATGKTAFKSPEINVLESGERTLHPELKFVWLDNERIRLSETEATSAGNFFRWVDLDVGSGRRSGERRYGNIGYEHARPSKDSREGAESKGPEKGAFLVEGSLLYFKGDSSPVGDLRGDQYNTDIAISGDGRWALFAGPKTGAYLADGVSKTKSVLPFKGYAFVWMPPAAEAR